MHTQMASVIERGIFDIAVRPATLAAPVIRDSVWREYWRRLRGQRVALVSLVALALVVFAAVLGPLLWTASPDTVPLLEIGNGNAAFSAAHPLGTDSLGHDTLARVLSSLRVSLLVVVFVRGDQRGAGREHRPAGRLLSRPHR